MRNAAPLLRPAAYQSKGNLDVTTSFSRIHVFLINSAKNVCAPLLYQLLLMLGSNIQIFSYASSSTPYPCEWVSESVGHSFGLGSGPRTSVAWSLRACLVGNLLNQCNQRSWPEIIQYRAVYFATPWPCYPSQNGLSFLLSIVKKMLRQRHDIGELSWWWIYHWTTPGHCQRTRHRVLRGGRTLGINANYIWLRRLSATLYILYILYNRTSPLITPIRWHYQARIFMQ